MKPLVALKVALVALLLVPAGAAADDAAVNRAWDSDDAQYRELGKQQARGVRIVTRRPARVGPVLRSLRRTLRVLRGTTAKVRAAQASSDVGRRAKRLALASLADFRSFLTFSVRGYRQGAMGIRRDSRSLRRAAVVNLRRANRRIARSRRRAERGKRLFGIAERRRAEAAPAF